MLAHVCLFTAKANVCMTKKILAQKAEKAEKIVYSERSKPSENREGEWGAKSEGGPQETVASGGKREREISEWKSLRKRDTEDRK